MPLRTSSGGLSAQVAGGLGLAVGPNAAAAGSAGGRGAGPDHREVRYADGVLAMINVLRLLHLGGPRTWDAATHKQVRRPRRRACMQQQLVHASCVARSG